MKFTYIKNQYKICLLLLLSVVFYGAYLSKPQAARDVSETNMSVSTEEKSSHSNTTSDSNTTPKRIATSIPKAYSSKINTYQEFKINGRVAIKGTITDYHEVDSKGDIKERILVVNDENFKYSKIRVEQKYTENANGEESVLSTIAMVADHVLVKVSPEHNEVSLNDLLSDYGMKVRRKMYSKDHYLIETPEANFDSVPEAIGKLSGDENFSIKEPDFIVALATTPDDTRYDDLWGLHNTGQTGGTNDADIDAVEAWNTFKGSRDIVVGVIDTGISYDHPDLAANMWTNSGEIPDNDIDDDNNGLVDDYYGYDFANSDGDPDDDNDHGTHCAGTIGGVGNNSTGVVGVNWEVSLMALKFLTASGGGAISDAVDCINYATDNDAHLTNNSWGGGGYSQAAYDAIVAANAEGSMFVAAAGNDSSNIDFVSGYPASYDVPNVISVAATDHNDQLAYFSNYGAANVDLGAPGVDILSTVTGNSYSSFNGTSMACPHVAGVCALLYGYDQNLTTSDIKFIVLNSGDSVSALSSTTLTGKRLNANNALNMVGASQLILDRALDGVSVTADSTLRINWSSLGVTGDVKVELLRQDGTLEGTITASHDVTYGQFNWVVPVWHALGTYTLRVTSLSNLSVYDEAIIFINAEIFPISLDGGWAPTDGADATFMPSTDDASEGIKSMKAESITHDQIASVEFTGDCVSGFVSFDAKTSSEYFFDYFRFYIDGVEQTTARLSGESGWQSFSFNVSAGNHTFKWVYEKDYSVDDGEDTAWFDNVSLPIAANSHALTVEDGSGDGSYQANENVFISADTAPSGYEFSHWTISNGGIIEDASDPTTTFTMPDRATTVTAIYTALPVYYTLIVNDGSGDGSYLANTQVAITADAPPSGYVFSHWTSNNGGSFANQNATSTTFTTPEGSATLTPNYVTTPASGTKAARYRVYNPNAGHHHYTTSFGEYDFLGNVGWNQEGVSCYIFDTVSSVDSVLSHVYYRTYNPNSGEHFWTMSEAEYNFLGTVGWNLEGTDGHLFAESVTLSVPLYRVYNPNSGYHHWTIDANEKTFLVSIGWNDEGIAGYVFTSP